jgi:hypothetical protein
MRLPFRRDAPMAICASYITLFYLCLDSRPATVATNQVGDIVHLLTTHVVEIEHSGIAFTAINAGVSY